MKRPYKAMKISKSIIKLVALVLLFGIIFASCHNNVPCAVYKNDVVPGINNNKK
jgi:hypothetical protein